MAARHGGCDCGEPTGRSGYARKRAARLATITACCLVWSDNGRLANCCGSSGHPAACGPRPRNGLGRQWRFHRNGPLPDCVLVATALGVLVATSLIVAAAWYRDFNLFGPQLTTAVTHAGAGLFRLVDGERKPQPNALPVSGEARVAEPAQPATTSAANIVDAAPRPPVVAAAPTKPAKSAVAETEMEKQASAACPSRTYRWLCPAGRGGAPLWQLRRITVSLPAMDSGTARKRRGLALLRSCATAERRGARCFASAASSSQTGARTRKVEAAILRILRRSGLRQGHARLLLLAPEQKMNSPLAAD